MYSINAPHVISEIIDDEVVILNFENGCYYSVNDSGMAVWESIREGLTQEQILADLHRRFRDAGEDAERDLSEILQTLEAEQLIIRVTATRGAEPGNYEGPAVPYVKPGLEKFTDLQELLLLDPIHDVDESGWPLQAP
jgi:hypothetical protein